MFMDFSQPLNAKCSERNRKSRIKGRKNVGIGKVCIGNYSTTYNLITQGWILTDNEKRPIGRETPRQGKHKYVTWLVVGMFWQLRSLGVFQIAVVETDLENVNPSDKIKVAKDQLCVEVPHLLLDLVHLLGMLVEDMLPHKVWALELLPWKGEDSVSIHSSAAVLRIHIFFFFFIGSGSDFRVKFRLPIGILFQT
jgi:hypothetical protein